MYIYKCTVGTCLRIYLHTYLYKEVCTYVHRYIHTFICRDMCVLDNYIP